MADITLTNLDSGGKSPAAARADILEAVQRVNALTSSTPGTTGAALIELQRKQAALKTSGLAGINSGSTIGQRMDIFIGDSITFGHGVTGAESWPGLLQKRANSLLAFGQGSYQSGGNLDRLTQTGTITAGTNGPVKASLIMSVGSTLSFTADHIDFCGFWFQRATGAGTITITRGGTTIMSASCAGAAASNVFSGVNGGSAKGGLGQTYTLTCTVSAVEIIGIFAMHDIGTAATNPSVLMLQGKSGYSTADFAGAAQIAAIKAQVLYTGYFARYIIALGTNDIYNPGKAVSAETYKSNLISIITQIGFGSAAFVLGVPLIPAPGTYSAVIEPHENYRKAVYEVADTYRIDVVDQSELDLVAVGAYQSDGLHPNNYGHALMSDYWFRRLYAGMSADDRSGSVTLTSPVVAAGGAYAPPAVSMGRGGKVDMSGTIQVTGVSKGAVIATMPQAFSPLLRRVFSAPTITGTGSATLLVDPTGQVTLFDYTAASITYVSLDCISYYCG